VLYWRGRSISSLISRILEKSENRILLFVALLNILILAPRFLPGIPLGIDATSHLSKILLMYNSYLNHGYIPSWNPDWYCGTPFLLFYPPLSYWIVFSLSFLGLGPILSYKIIDAFFYFVMPFIVYFLALEFNLKKKESAFAALIFTLSPVVIGNFLFYDRYPNTMALCLAGLLIIFIHKTLVNRLNIKWIIISTLLLASIILTHHLSAAYVALVILIIVVAFSWSRKKLLRNLGLLSIILILSILVSSFWSIPFLLNAPEQIGNNPFYNRTIDYPYLRLSYFLDNLLTRELGIVHFTILLASIWLFYNKSRFKNSILGNKVVFMIPLLAGMGIFELGELVKSNILIYLAQILVIFAFLFLLYLLIIDFKKGTIKSENFFFLLWFAIFLWLSLGYYAFPLARVPVLSTIWRSLDVHRFWLYLSIPSAILGGKFLNFLLSKRKSIFRIITIVILLIMVTGAFVKAGYCLKQEINDQLPYNVSNNFIPPELIDYFRSEEEYGRILAIKCPLWIYLVPQYTGKPLVDGWYPQQKLVVPLLNISDYRINDLETSDNRVEIWKSLIESYDLLGINWIMIENSNETLVHTLMDSSGFSEDAVIEYKEWEISIFKAKKTIKIIEVLPADIAEDIEFSRVAPDRIEIGISDLKTDGVCIIKEAFYPTWIAISEDSSLDLEKTENGFIRIFCPKDLDMIVLFHRPITHAYFYIAFITLIILMGAFLILLGTGEQGVARTLIVVHISKVRILAPWISICSLF
jgi:hypothetical protein